MSVKHCQAQHGDASAFQTRAHAYLFERQNRIHESGRRKAQTVVQTEFRFGKQQVHAFCDSVVQKVVQSEGCLINVSFQ